MTIAERARIRATTDRIRVVKHMANDTYAYPYYKVYNLTSGSRYIVWWNTYTNVWSCTCPAKQSPHRCKHTQRVLDREEKRIMQEALQEL